MQGDERLRALVEPTKMVPRSWGGEEAEWRMEAYYYGFTPTGIAAIDRILSAVAWAGKAYHHTEQWNDETDDREPVRGGSPAMWIENAAHDAAKLIRAALSAPAAVEGDMVLVPRDPTESMTCDGFESEPDEFFSTPEEWAAYDAMTGCEQGHYRARKCWLAMIARHEKDAARTASQEGGES